MCANNKTLIISNLSDDLLCKVFDSLSVKQVLAIQMVSKDFYQSVKKWLQTVDYLTIKYGSFHLRKEFGKPTIKWRRFYDWFLMSKEMTSLNKMLTFCTGIETVSISCYDSLPEPQLVELVFSSCPNIKNVTLKLGNFCFSDQFWSHLIELIKNYEIYVLVTHQLPAKTFNQLKQLFTTAPKIKFVRFISVDYSFLRTIAYLNESVRVKIDVDEYYFKTKDEQISDILAKKVDSLIFDARVFQRLSLDISCCLRLSHLKIKWKNYTTEFSFSRMLMSGLKTLKITDTHGYSISSFFAAVCQLNQLERLELSCNNINTDDQHLNEMMAKTPNITEVRLEWLQFKPTNISDSVQLVQFMSKSWTRLRSVEIKFQLINRFTANDFSMMTNLIAFVVDGMETKYKLIFVNIPKLVKFDGPKRPLPKNVEIVW